MAVVVDFGLVTPAVSGVAVRFKHWNLSIIVLIMISLGTIPIPFYVCYSSRIMEFFYVIYQPQLWVEAKQFVTQPVLFLLVNLVVLSIWISSGAASNCHSEVTKEGTVQSPGILPKDMLPSHSFTPDKQCKAESSVDGDPQARNVLPTPVLSSVATADPVQKKAGSPDKRDHKSSKSILRTASEANKYSSAAVERTKFQKRSPSLPSRVVVSNVCAREVDAGQCRESKCKQEVLVMEVDELNERIEAFFARFREKMRQESLSCQ